MSTTDSPSLAKQRAPRVLVVDDEADLRELLELTLVGMGLDVDCAGSLAQARQLMSCNDYQLCLTDMRLPDGLGLSLVEALRDTPVAVITAYGSAENAVAALKAGAFDYVSKPIALESLRALVRSALSSVQVTPEPSSPFAAMLGESTAMQEVKQTIARLARSMAPVSIKGESGSGKELAARLIHEAGARANAPFVAVNCGAIPENLMESEFFGHKKGSFTGADSERNGFFQSANGGTLFLDEVADLPLAMQVKLLRAIQEKRVRKIGANQEEPVDVRVVSATHQDLAQCVAAGRFRQDLFYRLNVIELRLPPLRERRDDIPVLAHSILNKIAARSGLATAPQLASVTLKYLQSYNFPGNVRELENILERALAFSDGRVLNVEDLGLRPAMLDVAMNERADDVGLISERQVEQLDEPSLLGQTGLANSRADLDKRRDLATVAMSTMTFADDLMQAAGLGVELDEPTQERSSERIELSADGIPECLPDYLDQVERDLIERALQKTRFNRTAAAKLLGVSFRALRYRMQRLDIS